MKTVWLLNHYAQEPGGPGGTRHFSLARHLRMLGWRAIIIASSVEHGTGRQRLAGEEKWQQDTYDGVEFLWLRGETYAGNGDDRIRNMLAYTHAALRIPSVVLPAPDIVVGSSVHPFAAWAGQRLAKRFAVPFVFEIRDLWPQTLIDMGRLKPNHPMTLALRWLERWLCDRACSIVTLLPYAHRYLETIGTPAERIFWVSNGVEVFGEPSQRDTRSEGQPFTLMYFGAHGAANGLDNVLRAMRLLLDRKNIPLIQLRLIGDGPEKPALLAMAADWRLTNVSFEPPVKKAEIPALAAQADAFVFNLIDAPVFAYGISSNKLFDYMAAERPIIFCCDSTNNPVADAHAGVTVQPGRPDELADAIVAIAGKSPEERAAIGKAGRAHVVANYSYDVLSAKFAAVLNECVKSR
ncbi:MAG TPA: glycosyltransferase family 4 protein [Devosiaceae bacterium]|jgi:glycosyltransferase involved in cell wall biosynthesis